MVVLKIALGGVGSLGKFIDPDCAAKVSAGRKKLGVFVHENSKDTWSLEEVLKNIESLREANFKDVYRFDLRLLDRVAREVPAVTDPSYDRECGHVRKIKEKNIIVVGHNDKRFTVLMHEVMHVVLGIGRPSGGPAFVGKYRDNRKKERKEQAVEIAAHLVLEHYHDLFERMKETFVETALQGVRRYVPELIGHPEYFERARREFWSSRYPRDSEGREGVGFIENFIKRHGGIDSSEGSKAILFNHYFVEDIKSRLAAQDEPGRRGK